MEAPHRADRDLARRQARARRGARVRRPRPEGRRRPRGVRARDGRGREAAREPAHDEGVLRHLRALHGVRARARPGGTGGSPRRRRDSSRRDPAEGARRRAPPRGRRRRAPREAARRRRGGEAARSPVAARLPGLRRGAGRGPAALLRARRRLPVPDRRRGGARRGPRAAGRVGEGRDGGRALAADAVFRRGVPESWNDLRLALFVRKGQQFERFDPALKTVDSVLAHAFRLAPAEPAVCVSAVGAPGTNYAIRASFGAQSRGGKPWEELLPSDACDVYVGRGVTSEAKRKAFGAAYERVRGKELWKEIDALGKDAPRLKLLLRETLGPEMVPSDETLARLPHDVALFGAIGGAVLEAAWFAPEAEYAVCQKIYRGSSTTIQAAFGADTDAFGLLVAAMAAETAVEKSGGWVLHDEAPGVHSWRVDVNKAIEAAGPIIPPDASSMIEEFWTPYAPSIVTGKGCIFIVLGEDMRKELVAILSGGGAGTLAADPLWREAGAAVDAGASTLHFSDRKSVV